MHFLCPPANQVDSVARLAIGLVGHAPNGALATACESKCEIRAVRSIYPGDCLNKELHFPYRLHPPYGLSRVNYSVNQMKRDKASTMLCCCHW